MTGSAFESLDTRTVSSGLLMINQAATLRYAPIGVVGVIGPWNYPVCTPMGSIAYALAAGNAVVFKPGRRVSGSSACTSTRRWRGSSSPPSP